MKRHLSAVKKQGPVVGRKVTPNAVMLTLRAEMWSRLGARTDSAERVAYDHYLTHIDMTRWLVAPQAANDRTKIHFMSTKSFPDLTQESQPSDMQLTKVDKMASAHGAAWP